MQSLVVQAKAALKAINEDEMGRNDEFYNNSAKDLSNDHESKQKITLIWDNSIFFRKYYLYMAL